jgi:mRNA-degrading endonuclease YafQ of YafQ-DinJ toxin-antitoxin module
MNIVYSPRFARDYKKLPNDIKDIAEENEVIFRNNPLNPRLKTRKLKGRLSGFLSFSIGYRYRVIFELSHDGKTAYFHLVGNHDIYQ